MKKKRTHTKSTNETDLLAKSARRCSFCFGINNDTNEKPGQIAHVNGDRSNSSLNNLAWLCLDHHDRFDGKTSQSKGLTINELKKYREQLYLWVSDNRIELKINSDISKSKTNSGQENKKPLQYEEDVVIFRLPRGFVLFEDIEFQEYSSWSVSAHYFEYNGHGLGGTHHHESYGYHRLKEIDIQCRKLGIPKSDKEYTGGLLDLLVELRTRGKEKNITTVIERFANYGDNISYHLKNEKIPFPQIPEDFKSENKSGLLRDIIQEMSEEQQNIKNLKSFHQAINSLRRKAYLNVYKSIDKNHPSLEFIKQIKDEYKTEMDHLELNDWIEDFTDAIIDSFDYLD